MQLSKRLQAVADFVTPHFRLADIGTDHGYVPIWLFEAKKIPSALAMDVVEGPLLRAKENIRAHHAEQAIETRKSDGLSGLKEYEADSVVIAGMGGMLIRRILTEGEDVLKTVKELVLAPQSDLYEVRRYLSGAGYQIIDENMVFEDGKYYPIIKAVHGKETHTSEIDLTFGYHLLSKAHPVLFGYLQKELQTEKILLEKLEKTDSERAGKRREEIKEELAVIKEALSCYPDQ